MSFPRKIALALALMITTGLQADAAVVTFTTSVSQTLPYTFTGTSQSYAAGLPQFPTTLGTLLGATIQQQHVFTVDASSQVEAGEYINGENVTSWTWATIAGFQLGVAGGNDTGTSVYLSTYGNYDSPVTPESAHVNFTTTVAGNTINVNANSLGSFTGNGSVPVSLLSGITTQIQPLPATLAGFTWQLESQALAGGIAMRDTDNLTVTYTYTPSAASVPEPGSMAMVSAGLGLVGIVRQVRRRVQHRV